MIEGEQVAFSVTKDAVKIHKRKQIEECLDKAKQVSWSEEYERRAGNCGILSPSCLVVRRKQNQDFQALLPSIAMLNRFPNFTNNKIENLPTSLSFTSYSTLTNALYWEGIRITIPSTYSLYGMGENAGGLLLNEMTKSKTHKHPREYDYKNEDNFVTREHYSRNRNTTVCWNTDSVFYDETFESLYQSHPWILMVRPDGSSVGVFIDCTYRIAVHFTETDDGENNQIYFLCDTPTGPPPVYFFHALSPQGVIQELSIHTGFMPLPPRWSLGYQQCRYSYYPDDTVRTIAQTFLEKQIPCDVIWMDIHYMDGYRCFTFNSKLFPDPKKLNSDLHEMGFKSVWMIDPGIKHEKGYFVYDTGTEGGHWVRASMDSIEPVIGKVWPGMTVFPDFTKEKTRKWWATLFHSYMGYGIDGVWNDMNEIASFQDGSTIPSKSYHEADENIGGEDNHARYHNVYGMLMTKASREGIQEANPEKRPFVLTRSNFIGGQRYAACWTGDNSSTWKHLHFSIPMVLNLGLSGQPFSGIDIGGFFDNASPELYARWVGIGSLLPFARAHSCDGTDPHEPWSFGKDTEDSCRRAIERRYRLIPYLYTLFYQCSLDGIPIARPLFFSDPSDASLRSVEKEFLLGENLLVHANTTPGTSTTTPILPMKYQWRKWMVLEGEEEAKDPQLPNLYQRSGSVIPIGPVVQNLSEYNSFHQLHLYAYLDKKGKASGCLYEDAGEGFDYQKKSLFAVLQFEVSVNEKEIRARSSLTSGKLEFQHATIFLHVFLEDRTLLFVSTEPLTSPLFDVILSISQ